jgi:hypothetical protein
MNRKYKVISFDMVLQPLQQICYVPPHLNNEADMANPENWKYPNGIQVGFVTSTQANGKYVFCRYWEYDYETKEPIDSLRTRANSEGTSIKNLYLLDTFVPGVVERVWNEVKNA